MVRRQPVDGAGVRAGGTAGRVVTDWNVDGARPMPASAHVAQAAEAAREWLERVGPLRTADEYARPMILGMYRLWELTERGEALSALVRADDSSGAALAELRQLLDVMGAVADLIACQASRCVAPDGDRARQLARELVEMVTRRGELFMDVHDDFFAAYDFD